MSAQTHPAIRLVDVKKTYGRGTAAQAVLKGVSLDIAHGELVALIGQSGSGKSTLLNLAGGLDRPDAGKVFIDGLELGALDDRRLARLRNERIGFVFQSFHLLDHLTLEENVSLPAFFGTDEDHRERALEVLDRVGLRSYAGRRPPLLSGGQKQRVAIARALFHKPAILLCDEPTGSLDSETGREVIELFHEIHSRDAVTLLIVTHEERVSSRAQRVVRIEDGLILSQASRSVELRTAP